MFVQTKIMATTYNLKYIRPSYCFTERSDIHKVCPTQKVMLSHEGDPLAPPDPPSISSSNSASWASKPVKSVIVVYQTNGRGIFQSNESTGVVVMLYTKYIIFIYISYIKHYQHMIVYNIHMIICIFFSNLSIISLHVWVLQGSLQQYIFFNILDVPQHFDHGFHRILYNI